jgi:hypothetical protein
MILADGVRVDNHPEDDDEEGDVDEERFSTKGYNPAK